MSLDIARIRLLCFDVDGTLHDTDDQYVRKLAGLLKPVKFLFAGKDPLKAARKLVMVTETPATLFFGLPDRLGIDRQLAAMGDYLYSRGLKKNAVPFALIPGVKEMLERLYPKFPLSVVTARGSRSTEIFLHQLKISSMFQAVATAQTCRHTKPYPDPILWAASYLGIPAEACLMIGDTTVDILAGKAAGAQTVGVLCGFGTQAELREAGADLILENTSKLAEIFD
jgi:phosphoglycolate phosphatase-like HAD superfamily hydrolase